MDFSDAFRLINLIVGGLMVFGGITQFFWGGNLLHAIIIGTYVIIFGLCTALLGPATFPRNTEALADSLQNSKSRLRSRDTHRSSSPSSAVESVSASFLLPARPLQSTAKDPRVFANRHQPIAVYIFIGSILLHDHVLPIIAGTIIGFVGIAYCALEFVPSIEPPQNMREADGGWGAETV
ncbi:hypothetical protein BP6252_08514 [Coleophoma cylindrospora]|uniref:Uncharacterized protein n=1 Tax=Coleophoma cylindrospora TaxID=1849047 RepID=A0A3D8R6P8_9HELO|nr:hypothetical protein BP6252_08514 [Coleophoma cylindrospora]